MAGLPQKTLAWLYDVLKREYHDPNRTYSDLAHVLARYPGFAPRTDVYTFETGAPALLVVFTGTIPVNFRGNTYRFPVTLWVPHAYPYEPPMCYVTPTDDMIIRPGQHVGGDGRIYHPYLAHWREHWERSNVLDLLSILSDIFAKEPPVMSRTAQLQQRAVQPSPPPVPPLPREMQPTQQVFHAASPPPAGQQLGPPAPPPPPPKQPPQSGLSSPPQRSSGLDAAPSRLGRYDAPPPLPGQGQPQKLQPAHGNGEVQGPPSGMSYMPQRSSSLRHSMPPPLPSQQPQPGYESHQYRTQRPRPGQSHQYAQTQPSQQPPYVSPPPTPGQVQGYNQDQYRQIPAQERPERPISQHYPSTQQTYQPPHSVYHQQHAQAQFQAPKPAPPPQPNLLDSPFDLPLPPPTSSTSNLSSNIPAPPIPVNPEKEALLSHLSHLLTTSLHQQISQNSSALQPLSSQHAALQQTMQTLNSELANLKTLHTTLSSNISLLQSSLKSADGTISSSHSRASRNDIPAVDEMLTAPTVVARQLYDAACEERGIEAAILALQEGFVRGRVGSEIWARRTRELAREGFKRRWMVKKIGHGMGLDLDAGSYGR
ncbi:hypothetical protein G647_08124 [Cladophialophora carrionii CBS 160.54]|uniref:UEV domain-containing protein n=1 Tax=Cladophialophora carrionii CBS 160.54 TaxID=1279043 RepID=V9CZM3_9EURO|nr:uncharacterized protein G647_08124 [Cladophialophora carrionii CBS 160.54]ETI20090.1 hypothetical protein G647_08124 [Cladophialophora carrionii CBS 160.54]